MTTSGLTVDVLGVAEGNRTGWAFLEGAHEGLTSGEMSGPFEALLDRSLGLAHVAAFVSLTGSPQDTTDGGRLRKKLLKMAERQGKRVEVLRLAEVVNFAGEPAKRLVSESAPMPGGGQRKQGKEIRFAEWIVTLLRKRHSRTWLRPKNRNSRPEYYSGRIRNGAHRKAEIGELERSGWRIAYGPALICRVGVRGPEIYSIGGKKRTELRQLTRAAKAVFWAQEDFLTLGPEHLVPLAKRDIAESIDLHESVFSRLTIGRFVHTPFGVFKLGFFFGPGVETEDERRIATNSLRLRIERILEEVAGAREMTGKQLQTRLRLEDIRVGLSAIKRIREKVNHQHPRRP